ncbi:MAG TPA: hypothetical protein VNJ09_11585, partial [Chthonomonadales bacterium]|nr:hypothetical protein [Chthonomonadales bacterium]
MVPITHRPATLLLFIGLLVVGTTTWRPAEAQNGPLLPLEPTEGAVLKQGADIRFRWTAEANARAYQLIIGHSPDVLSTPVLLKSTRSTDLEFRNFLSGRPLGTYFWAVRPLGVSPAGAPQAGPLGPVQSFLLVRINREDAISIVRQQVLAALPVQAAKKVLVLMPEDIGPIAAFMPQRPQSPGDVLRPEKPREDRTEEESRVVIDSLAWFCFVDLAVDTKFVHDVLFVLVDAATGAVTVREEHWWPVLNEERLYSTDEERAQTADRFEPPPGQDQILARRLRPFDRLMPSPFGRWGMPRVWHRPLPIRTHPRMDRPPPSPSGKRILG